MSPEVCLELRFQQRARPGPLWRLRKLTAANTWKAFPLFLETVTLSQVNLFCLLKEKVGELETRRSSLGRERGKNF